MKNSSTRNTVTKTVAPRTIVYVGPDTYIEGRGYRVSVVKEGETGHHPTGNWPYDVSKGHTLPWFWGPTLEEAEATAIEHNRKMGVEPIDAEMMVMQSMGLFPMKPSKVQLRVFRETFAAMNAKKPAVTKAKPKRKKK